MPSRPIAARWIRVAIGGQEKSVKGKNRSFWRKKARILSPRGNMGDST